MHNEIQSIIREIDALGEQMATALFKLSALKERLAAITTQAPEMHENTAAPEPSPAPAPAEMPEAETAPEPVAKDLRGAFTVNDRYRFRRELFGNSEGEMSEMLELLGAMASMDEVREYLLTDLGWDTANENVTDFLQIISLKF